MAVGFDPTFRSWHKNLKCLQKLKLCVGDLLVSVYDLVSCVMAVETSCNINKTIHKWVACDCKYI